MNTDCTQSLREAFVLVCKQLISFDARPLADGDGAALQAGCGFVEARTLFQGAVTGTLKIVVPDSFCPAIVKNALGMTVSDEEALELAGDALKELANVTCGRMLMTLLGKEIDYEPLVPSIGLLDADQARGVLAESGTAAFDLDGTIVIVNARLDSDGSGKAG